MNIMRMINPTQPYAWGSKTFIHKLLGDKSKLPIAELWMGAHPAASSQIQNGDKLVSLNEMLKSDPTLFMGELSYLKFGDELPFLLKVLAADSPLSIQVHPNQAQAKAGFERENQAGIELTSPQRNYKDPHHKPELIVALTPFTAMCGFRPTEHLTRYLKRYLGHCELPSFNAYLVMPKPVSLSAFYHDLMNLEATTRDTLLELFLTKIKYAKAEDKDELLMHTWVKKLSLLYPGDIGILSPLLLNIFTLRPLQALYLDAGVLHAYLEGAGMEIMASSDNVLRGGLTPKHIDVPELLSIIDFTDADRHVTRYAKLSDTEKCYFTPAGEFALSFVMHETKLQTSIEQCRSAEIIFCAEGSFEIENCSQILSLSRGQSLFVPFETEGYCIRGKGLLFRAHCNL